MSAFTILIYLAVAIVGNGAFYFACQGNYDSCSIVSTVFFNISVLCQFLPLLTNKEQHEKNQRNGQILICSLYLVAVVLWSAWSIGFQVSYVTSGTIQIILFGIFIIGYLSTAKANEKVTYAIADQKSHRSPSLIIAKANIRTAIATTHSIEHKTILREILAELDSMSTRNNDIFADIDNEIMSKSSALCNTPDAAMRAELSKLIQKRKSMTMLNLQ